MIASLGGTLSFKSPTEIILDVNGVGYAVSIPLSTFETLGAVGHPTTLLTYLHVREDALQLYGFASEGEKEMFKMLLSVTGIGPRMALGILSGTPVGDLKQNLIQGNTAALTSIPGIGKKLAERLVVELREKALKAGAGEYSTTIGEHRPDRIHAEAVMALVSLGYPRASAEKAVRTALASQPGATPSLEELIKTSLRSANR